MTPLQIIYTSVLEAGLPVVVKRRPGRIVIYVVPGLPWITLAPLLALYLMPEEIAAAREFDLAS